MVRVRERYQLHDPFVLYAGNVKPHKNLERLIEAFHLVRDRGLDRLKLVLIGDDISKYTALRRAVHRHQLHQYVRFLGYLPEETLAVMYRLAGVFVFPSLYEGFGLPPLEAMASGTPVVTSNVSSLPEVAGDAAVLVDPYDTRAIADGIYRVLTDQRLRADLKRLGLARAGQFSWESSVRRVREIYEQVGQWPIARIAFVHDWLTGMRGGEKVLDALCERFPQAEVFTLVHVRGSVSPTIERTRTAHLVRAAPAVRQAALPDVPAALSDGRRAVRLRRLRPHRQHEPLLREVDRPARPGPAPLLLPDADALRLGPVRRVLRPGSDRDGRQLP